MFSILDFLFLPSELRKFDGYKIEHIWDVIQLFFELSRALEMRDAIIGSLSDAFKLESIDGKTATSKQVHTYENDMRSGEYI